jgi:GxxExxY protein
MINNTYKHSEITGEIIGCAMEVHNVLGNGFQELIYQRALAYEMSHNSIKFKREYEIPVIYKEKQMGTRRVDFLVERIISVEIKAIMNLEPVHFAQAINYLEAYNLEVGLLINFGAEKLMFKRLHNNKYKPV